MPHRKRKTRKLRGSRTMGYGRVAQHRKSGSRGGRGKAGMHKHKWSYTVKYAPNHFGKHGFKSIHPRPREINVGDLEKLIEQNKYTLDENNIPVIDLTKEGYGKLIGKGTLDKKVKVIVKSASKRAIEKIKSLSGEVKLV